MTFIELMVVVVILGVLAALIMPRIVGRTDDAKRTAVKVQIRSLESALQLFKLDNAFYPSTQQGLKALVEKPASGKLPTNWKTGGYVPSVPKDPWGNDYIYLQPGTHGEFDLLSYGADGERGGEDNNADIENWSLDQK